MIQSVISPLGVNLQGVNLQGVNLQGVLSSPSPEQQVIINHIITGENVVVDACAGSGKSTTILSCAQAEPHKKFLQLTYNSALREDILAKIAEYKIKNLEVHTYHSLAVKYFLRSAHTDTGIRAILDNQVEPLTLIPAFHVIVLDEAQDMTLLYYRLIVYFTKKIQGLFQMLILGDWMQGLYEFKGADIRFLTLGKKIWENYTKLSSPVFHTCTLHVSYRITRPMAKFVNDIMIGEERLIAIKDGQKVLYIRNSRSKIEKIVVYHIKKLLDEGAQPSDIFVLGGSVSGANSNIRKMENALVESGIPTYVPLIELADKLDERVIKGKVVFSTFHSVKGRQRPYVFIVGFDNSYFTFCARNLPTTACPNTLYVGCTRATHGLYLLENDQYVTDRPLDFLRKSHHDMKNKCSDYMDFKGQPQTIFYESKSHAEMRGITTIPLHHITPTALIKFIPESVIEEISPLLDKIFAKESIINASTEPIDDEFDFNIIGKSNENQSDNTCDKLGESLNPLLEIEIPSIIETKRGFHEDVSDLNGIAIPNIYYDYMENKMNGSTDQSTESPINQNTILYDIIESRIQDMKQHEHTFLKRIFKDMSPTSKEPRDYLYMANMYVSVQERLYYKLMQIQPDEYTWLTPAIIDKCTDRLDKTVGKDCIDQEGVTRRPIFEETIIHYTMDDEHIPIDNAILGIFGQEAKFRFSARVDLITPNTVWELKCTSQLSIDNLLQVVIYAWLWRTIHQNNVKRDFKILNIKTGEILRLDASLEELDMIMGKLLKGKYSKTRVLSDDDFLQDTGNQGFPVRPILLQDSI